MRTFSPLLLLAAVAGMALGAAWSAPLILLALPALLLVASLPLVDASRPEQAPQPLRARRAPRWLHVVNWHVERALFGLRDKLGDWLTIGARRLGLALYAFQSTVNINIGFGVIGEILLDGPFRAQPGVIKVGAGGATAADLVVGRWYTIDAADGQMIPGGAGAIGGVLINPKNMASIGTAAGGALAPTLTVPAGTLGEFCYMGEIVVALGAAVAIGAAAKYNTTTGVILSGAPGAGEAAIPNGKFVRYANAAAGLAVLELTN